MNRWIANTRVFVLGLFLIGSLAATGYEWWFVWPVQKCERAGAWWDPADRQCLTPMPIWRITGRPPSEDAAHPGQPPVVQPKANPRKG
jgi:hypothetical protein